MLNLNLLLACISLIYLSKPRVINGLKVSDQFNTISVVLNSHDVSSSSFLLGIKY